MHPSSITDVTDDRGDVRACEQLRALIEASWMTQAIAVAAELGLADLLASGPKSVSELASITSTHAPSLHRLLRGLASLDICAEEQDAFVLRPTGVLLPTDAVAKAQSDGYTVGWSSARTPLIRVLRKATLRYDTGPCWRHARLSGKSRSSSCHRLFASIRSMTSSSWPK